MGLKAADLPAAGQPDTTEPLKKMGVRGLSLRLFVVSLVAVLFTIVWASNGSKPADVSRIPPMETRTDQLKFPDLYEASIAELQEGMEKGLFTSVDLVKVPLIPISLSPSMD